MATRRAAGEWVRRFLQRPGTVDLRRYSRLLPGIAERETALRNAAEDALAGLAGGVRDDAEFCAVAREAARRGLGQRAHDVQVLGTLAMLDGHVAQMATGEGKTLSGALAAAGYARHGRSVQVLSVNDYLARRDAEWMRPVYDLLGMTVGHIGQASSPEQRRRAYAAQVTYAPVSEVGFDVLRDRLCTHLADRVTRPPDVVLIDEADSVLIDEGRVPLVLAGAVGQADADTQMAELVRQLSPGAHYRVDDDGRNVELTAAGARAAERALGGTDLYADPELETLTRLNVALHAHALLRRDIDYLVRDGRVHLISPTRGRVAHRQRWPDGLQAAVEAKEGLVVRDAGEVLDSVTVQSLVRGYRRVCGMTGTAVAVAEQLRAFHHLEVAVIPPNQPCVREDQPDRLYATLESKEQAIISEVVAAHAAGRPVLIGTGDVAESQRLADRLTSAGVSCAVLNAKNDEAEAAIVAEAGALGRVTVSTQMAGRGTDIRLGGSAGSHDQLAELGGLYVIGAGRHPSSRLDDQLRGRAGRQGDPGGSVFFVSLDDDLIARNAPDTPPPGSVAADGRVLDSRVQRWVNHAQRVAEGADLEIHRNTARYATLADDQRQIALGHRERVLRTNAARRALARRCPERVSELAATLDPAVVDRAARQIVLYHLDRGWADHLAALAEIREGIHLRALGHGPNPFVIALDPLTEFHAEAVRLFARFVDEVEERSVATFQSAVITRDGIDLPAMGLARPTATWTYVVQDNPFGNDMDRALRRMTRAGGERG